MADFNPSYAVIKSAILQSYDGNAEIDIKGEISSLEFMQSINSTAWTGSITVLDTTGILENAAFKIRGEEKLLLEVESFDLKMVSPLKLSCQVISITDLVPMESLTGVQFTLNFISEFNFKVGKRRVRESFVNLRGDEIVERIFEKFYGKINPKNDGGEILPFKSRKFITSEQSSEYKKPLYIQETEGMMETVIPNLMPADAMRFLTERSFSQDAPSCTFRFFETFKGFYYVTDEWLIKYGLDNNQTIEEFAYNAVNSQDSTKPELQTNTFASFKNQVRVNSAADIQSGGYTNVAIEIDLGRRRARDIKYDFLDSSYVDMTGKKSSYTDRNNIHTEDFIVDTFNQENARRYLVFKDYYDEDGGTLRANQHYPEIVQNKRVYGYHLAQTVVNARCVGRLDLEPGKIIKVKVPKFSVQQSPDAPYNEQLSGNYMIVSITHQLQDDVMNTNLVLAKYGWSGDYKE